MANTTVKPVKMPNLEQALDEESYKWLAENQPDILNALEADLANDPKRDIKPDYVRLYVNWEYDRPELAQRLRHAARHIQRAVG